MRKEPFGLPAMGRREEGDLLFDGAAHEHFDGFDAGQQPRLIAFEATSALLFDELDDPLTGQFAA